MDFDRSAPRSRKEANRSTVRAIMRSLQLLSTALILTTACVSTSSKTPPKTATPPRPPPPTEPASRVALLSLEPSGPSSEELANTLAELIAFELADTGRFDVMSKNDLAEALRLKGIQQGLGCETDKCQADLAKSVDIDQFVTGSLGKLGDKFVLVLRLVGTNDVKVVRQARDTAEGREEDLMAAVQRTSWTLAGIENDTVSAASTSRKTSSNSSAVAGRIIRGGVFGGMRGVIEAVAPEITSALETQLAQSLQARIEARRAEREAQSK